MRHFTRPAQLAEVAVRTAAGFSADRCGIAAAGITYFALISIFPLALVALSVAGFVYRNEADQDRLLDSVMEHLPIEEDGGRDELDDVIGSIVEARGTLGALGILGALYTGSSLFTAVRVALNGIFRGEKPRPFIIGKLIDIGLVTLLGILALLSTAASFALTFAARYAEDIVGPDATTLTNIGLTAAYITIPPLFSFGLFLALYGWIPAAAVGWRSALPGALLAALLFEVLKAGFGQYAARFGNYDATYGSLGFVILLLAFIYFASQVMLLGAEAARATSEVRGHWPLSPDESRLQAIRLRVAGIVAKVRRILGRRAQDAPSEPAPAAPARPLTAGPAPSPAPEPNPFAVSLDSAPPREVRAARPGPLTSLAVVLVLVLGFAATALAYVRPRSR